MSTCPATLPSMRKTLAPLGLLSFGLLVGGVVGREAWASRNTAGAYTLPAGNPVVSGTTITSTWANATLSDLATEMEASLSRDGKGAMRQSLQLSGGTSSLPSMAWALEPSSGWYRAGSNDLRFQVGANTALQCTATVVTVPLGLVVTQDTSNGTAVTATGNGSGAGVSSTGGSSGGAGGTFVGGASNGVGLTATGNGTAAGATFTGGATSGAGATFTGGAPNGGGLTATGDGTGAGLTCTGGDSSGTGGVFTGGASNGRGLTTVGDGTGAGLHATGGDSDGDGIVAVGGASNGRGGVFTGSGTATGIQTTGQQGILAVGTTYEGILATGAAGQPGVRADNGTAGTSVTPQDAIFASNGGVYLGGTAPGKFTAVANRLHATNLVKVWARITTDGVGGITVFDGFNLASCTLPGSSLLRCDINSDMANTAYAVIPTGGYVGGGVIHMVEDAGLRGAGYVYFRFVTAGGITEDPATAIVHGSFVIFGAQ